MHNVLPCLICATNSLVKKGQISALPVDCAVALETINLLNFGMVIIGSRRRTLYMNDVAKMIIKQSEVLAHKRNVIRLLPPSLESWLANQFREYRPDSHAKFALDGDRQLVVSIRPLPETDHARDHPLFSLSLSHSSNKPSGVAESFSMMFSLTQREAEVAELMVGGCIAREVAEVLGVNESTVRSHIKKIYVKTGVTRQTSLVRLGMQLCFL